MLRILRRTSPLLLCLMCGASWSRFASAADGSTATRIGNLYRSAPNGIAFVRDDAAAFVLDPGGPHNAGTVAPDDSYHRVLLPQQNREPGEIEFVWTRIGNAVVARLRSQNPTAITFTLNNNWPGFSSAYAAAAHGIRGVASSPSGQVTWRLEGQPAPNLSDGASIVFPLAGPHNPTYFVAGFGRLPPLNGVDDVLAQAKRQYEQRRPRGEGASGDILGAITDNLNNSRVYSTDNRLTAITVSRTFGPPGNANDAPYFEWDSFFNGLLASIDNPEAAHNTVRAILSGQSADGSVPNFTHWNLAEGRTSTDRSQPPVGSMCVWKMHQRRPDISFLREVYPRLARWHAWWMKARNARGDGLLEWGSSNGTLQAAQWETGWDDTPHFEGVPGVKMVGHTMNVYAVDLNALWAMDAQYLALIARTLGEQADAQMFEQQATAMNARINARLWNRELGIYCSRFWDGEDGTAGKFLTRITPANFYPLISGAASAEQAKSTLAVMTDPRQFWGEWILPTVSRSDPLFFQQRYWHGTIWGPVNYLVFQGLKRYAPKTLQAEFAQRSVRLFMNNWLGAGLCGENFSSLNGRVSGNQNYTWGALLALIGVEAVVDIDNQGRPHAGPGYNEAVTLHNIPVGGRPYRVTLAPQRWSSSLEQTSR